MEQPVCPEQRIFTGIMNTLPSSAIFKATRHRYKSYDPEQNRSGSFFISVLWAAQKLLEWDHTLFKNRGTLHTEHAPLLRKSGIAMRTFLFTKSVYCGINKKTEHKSSVMQRRLLWKKLEFRTICTPM